MASLNGKQNKKQLIFSFILLGIIVYGIYLLLSKFWSIFATVDPKLGVGIIATSGTIIVTLISVLVSKHLERKAQILTHLSLIHI